MKSSIQSFAAILTMFAGLMAASKFAGANAAKAGVGILAMSASLILGYGILQNDCRYG